ERRREQRGDALAAQAFDRDRVDGDAVLRYQPGFHAAVGAEPGYGYAARLQRRGHRQAREDVAAGTAGENEDGPVHDRFLSDCQPPPATAAAPSTGSTRPRPRPRVVGAGGGCVVGGTVSDGAGAAASPRRRATWRCARSSS